MIPFRLNAMREVRDDLVEETVNDLCAYTVNGTRVDTADGLFFASWSLKDSFFHNLMSLYITWFNASRHAFDVVESLEFQSTDSQAAVCM